jgi:hypothetical protein
MYTLYADNYCAMCDEHITEFWGDDKHKVKKAIKRIMRKHTPRICKKRLARLRKALSEGAESKDGVSWKKPGNLDYYKPPFISSFLPSFLRGGVR